MKLNCDKNFILRDENALFECMGLRRPQGDEIYKIFGPELKDFLTNQPLIKSVASTSKNLTQD